MASRRRSILDFRLPQSAQPPTVSYQKIPHFAQILPSKPIIPTQNAKNAHATAHQRTPSNKPFFANFDKF
nr:hypothetical protein [uncultured Kingella sp.]